MIKPVIVVATLSFVCTPRALAADVEVPAARPPSAAANYYPATAPINWGGIYFGINGGYSFGSSTWTNLGVSTGSFVTNGAILGGTAGLNFAGYGGFVFGVEGDLDWAALSGNSSVAACVGLGAPAGTTCGTKTSYLSTARARVGYAFDHILFFGTAGAAIGDFRVGLNPPGTFDMLPSPQAGWTAGAGIEYAFADNLTAKVEYLYVDLGTAACPMAGSCGVVSGATVSLTESLVRVGINYKFTW